MNHLLYLVLAVVTHAVLGYALVRVLTPVSPAVGLLGGVFPDVDLYFGRLWNFPLVHRGLVHTPLFLGTVVVGLLLAGVPEWAVVGVGVAFLSHLAVDSFTHAGIMWLYPVSVQHFSYDVSAHSAVGDAVLWAVSAGMVRWGGRDALSRLVAGDGTTAASDR